VLNVIVCRKAIATIRREGEVLDAEPVARDSHQLLSRRVVEDPDYAITIHVPHEDGDLGLGDKSDAIVIETIVKPAAAGYGH
jgi:hypothetical protein